MLNFGVTGYSPAQVLLTAQQEVDRYDLDIIVVSVFLDNDVYGSIAELSVSTTGTPFVVAGPESLTFDAIPTHYELYFTQNKLLWNRAREIFERTLVEIIQIVTAKNKTLVLLSIPAGQTVNVEAWQNIVAANSAMVDHSWDLSGPENRCAQFAKDHSIPLIQPYANFQKLTLHENLYFGDVGHLTATGHKEIATHAFPQMMEALLTYRVGR